MPVGQDISTTDRSQAPLTITRLLSGRGLSLDPLGPPSPGESWGSGCRLLKRCNAPPSAPPMMYRLTKDLML